MTKRKRHTPEQVIRKLGEADAMLAAAKDVGQVCQALEMSDSTLYGWRNQYGRMKAEEAKRLKYVIGRLKSGRLMRRHMGYLSKNSRNVRGSIRDRTAPAVTP